MRRYGDETRGEMTNKQPTGAKNLSPARKKSGKNALTINPENANRGCQHIVK